MGGMSNTLVINEAIRRQAERQATHSYGIDGVVDVYWFPHDEEVRTVVTDATVDPSPDGLALAFRFKARPRDGIPFADSMAVILPEEFGRLELPSQWGTWDDAIRLPERQ